MEADLRISVKDYFVYKMDEVIARAIKAGAMWLFEQARARHSSAFACDPVAAVISSRCLPMGTAAEGKRNASGLERMG